MAKRLAGSQINHENWDNEDESEEAGQFKQAPETEIKGRVIKKARRRNPGGGEEGALPEKTNAFAGFGGFSNTTSASDAFSFLAKSPSTTSLESKKPEIGSFVFGAKSDSSKSPPTGLFGSATAEAAKPSFGGFSFGKKPDTDSEKASSAIVGGLKPVTETDGVDIFSKFKPKTGSWGCDTCMISNDADKVRCAACETPKPGSKPVEQDKSSAIVPSFGESGGFKFGSSATSGSATLTTSGFSFGSVASSPSSLSGAFTFGSTAAAAKPAPAESATSNAAPSGFVFSGQNKPLPVFGSSSGGFGSLNAAKSDASLVSAASPPPSVTAFSFGSSAAVSSGTSATASAASPKVSSAPTSTFSFGASAALPSTKSADKPVLGGFSFGAAATAKPEKTAAGSGSSPFVFGKQTPAAPVVATPTASENKILTPAMSTAAPTTDSTAALNPDFLAHLKALNVQVTEWIRSHIEENPLVILSPVFKDYENYLKEITDKYPPPAAAAASVSAAPSATTTAAVAKPLFGAVASEKPAESTAQPFSFGLGAAAGGGSSKKEDVPSTVGFKFGDSSKEPSSLGGGFSFGSSQLVPSGGFSFGLTASQPSAPPAQASTEAGDEDEEDIPPKVEIKQVTEDDALYSKKCKLFYKKEGSFVEKGVGMLYLKGADNGKTQLLMRADTNLGNILLNILLSDQIPTTRLGKNNVMLICVPNPPVDPKADTSVPVNMLFRVKTSEDADELKSKLDEYKAKKLP